MHSMEDPMTQNGIHLHLYVFEKYAANKWNNSQAKNERDANVDSILPVWLFCSLSLLGMWVCVYGTRTK